MNEKWLGSTNQTRQDTSHHKRLRILFIRDVCRSYQTWLGSTSNWVNSEVQTYVYISSWRISLIRDMTGVCTSGVTNLLNHTAIVWLTNTRGLIHMRHDSHEARFIWDMIDSYETWLIHMRHDWLIWRLIDMRLDSYETWFIWDMIHMRHDSYETWFIWDIIPMTWHGTRSHRILLNSFTQNTTQLVHTKHYSGLQIWSHQIVQQPSVVAARNERPQTRYVCRYIVYTCIRVSM